MGWFQQLLSPDFMPHGYCYLWDARMVWLHVISDGLITLSYYCIPVVLIYFIRKNRDIPFNRIFWMFGTFILACGTTHLIEIWNVWHGSYLLAGVVKAITAVVSVITAAMLIPLVPKVISLPGRAHLQEVNRKLEQEIAQRKRFDMPIDAPLRRRVTVGFIVAVLLTLFIGFSSWRGARRAEQDAYWVSHTHEVMETIQRTTRHAIEAATSARAFALSGQEPLLANYTTARQSVGVDEARLRQLTVDNLSQQPRLDLLEPQLRAAFDFADSIIAKRRKLQAYPGGEDALETERLLDGVRASTRDMYDEETRLLGQRTQRAGTGQQLARIIAIAGAFLAVGLWSLARFAVNREIDVSERARAQVNTLNAELEQRVAQRTAALQSEIAERKRAEKASETVLRELADQKFALDQHAIVAVTDVQGTITYVNDKFCAISKYPKEELIGKNHRILNSGYHPIEFFQQMYQAIAKGKVWHGEIRNRAKDGSIYWVDTTIVPTLSTEGKPRQYVAIRADITERKQAEEVVKESLATSKAALKDLADQKFALDQHAIVAVTDVQGTITYVNDKFCAVSKYSKEELIGQNHRILNSGHHPIEFFQQMYHTIANGKVWHGEIKNRAKDGSIYWVDTTIVPFVGEDGKPRQYVAIRADISERKRTEEGRERLAAVVESSDDAIIGKTLEGTITAWNRGAEKVFGYSAAEAVGQPMLMLLPSERANEEPEILARISRGESVEHFETVRVRKDGRKINISATISPIRDSSGAIVGASKIARDITASKRAEQAVKESLATSEAALKELSDQKFALDQHAIVAMTDIQGTITYVNDKFCAISQFSRAELIGQNHRILNSGHHSKEFFQQMYHTIAKGKVWHGEIKNRAKDGSIYWVDTTIVPFLGADGKPRQYVAIRADITERKMAGEALVAQALESSRQAEELARSRQALEAQTLTLQYEARYRSLLEAAPDAMVVVNEGGEIVRFNVQAEKQFGYRGDELVGQKVNKFIPGGFAEGSIADGTGSAANELAAHIDAGIELCGRRKDGSEFPIEIKLSPLESPEGILVTAAIRDISVLKQSEEELVKTVGELKRSNAELQQFAYVSSHDLQEPLRMVASYTQLLASRYKGRLDSDADEFIAFAVDGCNRMQVLIQDLLTYSRAGAKATTLRKTATGNALQEALTNLRARIEENGAVVTHDALPEIATDAKLLAQVFQNLVGNAIKYRSAGVPTVHVSASQNGGNEWIFSVRDNGLGIDPKYFERIFILFQRLHGREEFEGTGIGLSICKKIVERLGGRIWVESQPGNGSTFYFALPEREGK
jgi:PAS domain S-box-containing protein